jgi:hypothetical protein
LPSNNSPLISFNFPFQANKEVSIMTDAVQINGPVKIQSDAAAQVAFELMDHISRREGNIGKQNETREYWLTLYSQCYKATHGVRLQHVLEKN